MTDSWPAEGEPGSLTVADLLDLPVLRAACVLAGAAGLGAQVTGIGIADPATLAVTELQPGQVLLLTSPNDGHASVQQARWEHLIDVIVVRAKAAQTAAILLPPGTGELSSATQRLAERLGVPLLLRTVDHAGGADLEVAVELRCATRDVEAAERARLLRLATLPADRPRLPVDVVAALDEVTGGRSSVVSARRGLLAGPAVPVGVRAKLSSVDTPTVFGVGGIFGEVLTGGGEVAVVLPVWAMGEGTRGWAVVCRSVSGQRWADLTMRALGLVRGDLVAWLAVDQFEAEREASLRATVLTEIVEQAEGLSPVVARRAESVGWRLSGWHVGLYIRLDGAGRINSWTVDAVLARLSARGIEAGPAVERSDGWVAWMTTASPPSPQRLRAAVAVVREELVTLAPVLAGAKVVVGVGSARRDAPGIAKSVMEAREAALISGSDADAVTVHVVQDLGASSILLGWYGSPAFTDLAREVLGPLVEAEDPQLLATLAAYLERSCSTAHTARALGVHRNTVAHRLARVEKLLGISLAHPDTRLALQLALRADHDR